MFRVKIIFILALIILSFGCAKPKPKPTPQNQIPYYLQEKNYHPGYSAVAKNDKPCECPQCPECPDNSKLIQVSEDCADISMVRCLAECRKKLIDLLDNCYRDPSNFVPYQQTETGRALYLIKVNSCISVDDFQTYKAGEEICETVCRGKQYSP